MSATHVSEKLGGELMGLALLAGTRGVVGVERDRPSHAHAVTMESIVDAMATDEKRNTLAAACGAQVALLGPGVPWAPRVRGTGATRCSECERLNGKRIGIVPRWARPRGGVFSEQEGPQHD